MTATSLCLPDLKRAYRDGREPTAVVQEIYQRIEEINDPGLFLDLLPIEDVLDDVAQLQARAPVQSDELPLWGVPFAVKDNIDVAGRPTTAGCSAFSYTPDTDAVCVARLRAAGAILIGKTNLDQFATGLVGLRTFSPPPRNAINSDLIPGGSSSGSAVAVAHGLVSFSLGTDTAGSGRVPAGLNGIVGLKPTLGSISATGVVPACRTLDTVSIFALTCSDAAHVFSAVSGFDVGDPYSRTKPVYGASALPAHPTIAIPDAGSLQFYGDADQETSFQRGIALAQEIGGTVREIDFSALFDIAEMLYEGPWVAERYTVIEPILKTAPDAVHPVTRTVVSKAERFSAADTFTAMYRLQVLKRQAQLLLDGVDMVCVPTLPRLLRVGDVEADPIHANSSLGLYTNFVNLLDMCGIAVPVGGRPDGLPGSLTLLASAHRDCDLAAFAARLQAIANAPLGATSWALPEDDASVLAVRSDEIEVAVVGAHMSGLPLNGELTRLGARFLRKTETADCYRLYRLAGGPPERPGLVRETGGKPIALETWALPKLNFGEFIAGIPQPLGIGTVTLTTNETVKGFLCEPAGLTGAQDITEFGGWRPFLKSRVSQ